MTPNEGDKVKCIYCEKEHELSKLEASLGVFVCSCGVSTQYTDKGWTRGVWKKETLESMCKRCGTCCHEKLVCNGRIYIFMKNACPWLEDLSDRESGVTRCRCYESRLAGEGCITLREAIKKQILPIDCGYRDMFPKDYVPPKRVSSLKDLAIG